MGDYLGLLEGGLPTIPMFARDDKLDPVSGKNNVIPCSDDQKLWGWFPYRKRPERGVMNWLHRKTYECFDWMIGSFYPAVDDAFIALNDRISALEPPIRREWGILNCSLFLVRPATDLTFGWTTPGINSEAVPRDGDRRYLDFTVRYSIIDTVFCLSIPEATCNTNFTGHTDCQLRFNDGIPYSLTGESGLINRQKMQCLAHNNPAGLVNAYVQVDQGAWSEGDFYMMLRTEQALSANMTNNIGDYLLQRSTGLSGLPCQTIIGSMAIPLP